MGENNKSTIVTGAFWKTLEQYGVIGIQLLLQIVLARILEPSAFGVIAIVGIFIGLSNVFVKNGLSIALVQQKTVSEEEKSSLFHFSLLMAFVLYALLFFASPYISVFFKMPQLTGLIRVMGLSLFFQSYSSIVLSLLQRDLRFKAIFISNIVPCVLSGTIAIVTSYLGLEVWALALHQILYSFFVFLCLFILTKWRPCVFLKFKQITRMLSFGWKVLLTNLIDELFAELRSLVIGRKYTSESLAFFNRGKQFPNLMMSSVNGALQAVLLPSMSKSQDNMESVRGILYKSVSISTYIMFPLLAILAFCAYDLIYVVLTEKWLPCVIFLQIHCLFYATWPLTTINTQALLAIGKSGTVFWLEATRIIIDLVILFLSMPMGVVAIAWGQVIVSFIYLIIYLIVGSNVLSYSLWHFLKTVYPSAILSIIIGVVLFLISGIEMNSIIRLMVELLSGLSVFLILSKLFQYSQYEYIKGIVVSLIKKS